MSQDSLATGQRSLADESVTYPLRPPLVEGCPETSTAETQYPVEVTYDYDAVDPALFDRPVGPGLRRWQPLLPPLSPGLDLGAGGTPLVEFPDLAAWAGYDGSLHLKDESRNPTWSHKDRLAAPTVSAAVAADAPGVAVSSSGNHGAAVAAHAARADLPCVVFTGTETGDSMLRFMRAYGAAVVAVDSFERWDLLRACRERAGFHPMSNLTDVPTGHPFGPEGYKPIAYECYRQLGGALPGTVFVPTSGAELLFGVWKGFRELRELGVVGGTPRMVACEPAARAPLSAALAAGKDAVTVEPGQTAAHSIKATTNSYRGVRAVRDSGGYAVEVTDDEVAAARDRLARAGLWQEFSGAAGLAGLRKAVEAGRPVEGSAVCLATSSGFKDPVEAVSVPRPEPTWDGVREALAAEYGLELG